jgi:hypothetical protein
MNSKLADWANIAQIVTAIAVVASLFYIGHELHLSSINSRLANIQAITGHTQTVALAIATNPDLAETLETSPEELTGSEVIQIRMLLAATLRGAETAFILYSDGGLDEKYWRGMAEEILMFMEKKGWQEEWRLRRNRYDPDFAEWLDQAVKDRYGG